ncbi:DNA polymerase III subunit delta [Amnibacterium sp. CER49]|uniref:DNA polymerase III subunit delta n=1 Tax=Amnibacterium sp. CER49 TaxID=3039161 RepID=UPI00244B404E|nr:DNA polymerase III subunit delta [Amnibacterium sp. CER49]MDH2442459.1 DNA polymerase III subunit delta [Amnibacterium sp. CER49]
MAARAGSTRATAAKAAGPRIPVLVWDEVRPAPVVLVSGPEDLLAERATRRLREVLAAADPSLEVSDLDASNAAPGDLSTLASPSLFGEPRLIRVTAVERLTDGFLAEAMRYLEAPADDTTLVLRHSGGTRGKRLLDAVRGGLGGGVEVACAELKRDADRSAFAAAEFRAARKRISPGALRVLVSAFQADLAELASACQQLIRDTAGDVTEATVETYYAGRVETNAFAVADAALAGRRGDALVLLRHAIATGADPVPIVAAIASKVRTMARIADAHGSSARVASEYGLAPWQVDRARRDLEGWQSDGVGRAILLVAETDERVKSGARDPEYAVERLVAFLAGRGEG